MDYPNYPSYAGYPNQGYQNDPRYPSYEEIPDMPEPTTGFVAANRFAKLKYDLRPYVDSYGVMPEPSEQLLEEFRETELETITQAEAMQGVEPMDKNGNINVEALKKVMETSKTIRQKYRASAARVCGGRPPQKDIYAMPPLVFSEFYGWLREQLGEN